MNINGILALLAMCVQSLQIFKQAGCNRDWVVQQLRNAWMKKKMDLYKLNVAYDRKN